MTLHEWTVAAAVATAMAACTPQPAPRPDAADADATDAGPTDAHATDIVADGGASEESALRALLDDPAPLRTAREAPSFADPAVMALRERVRPPTRFAETPSAEGWIRDRTEDLPAVQALAQGRAHVAIVRVSVSGGGAGATAGSLAVDVGAIVPRRIDGAEAGDAWVGRGRGALPPTPAALRQLEFAVSTADEDSDELEAAVFLGSTAAATLAVTFGGRTATLSLASREPVMIALDDGRTIVVSAQLDPAGACVTSRALLRTRAARTATGVIGEFRGVLIESGAVQGAVRGVFGRNSMGRDVAYLQVIGDDGATRFTGAAAGAVSPVPLPGRLRAAGAPSGTFILRGQIDPERPSAAISLELHTDCR